MYKVKTRNWNNKRWVMKILDWLVDSRFIYAESIGYDNKYFIETRNPLKAWGLWACFMGLKRFSGGWTYIIRPGKELGSGYKSIY